MEPSKFSFWIWSQNHQYCLGYNQGKIIVYQQNWTLVFRLLEQMHWFQAIFETFGRAVFQAIEVKGQSRLNFEAATSKFCNQFWKFGYQPRKNKTDLCMKNGAKVLIDITLKPLFLHYLQEGKYKRQLNQNFGIVCHTEVCLTFSKLATTLMLMKFYSYLWLVIQKRFCICITRHSYVNYI